MNVCLAMSSMQMALFSLQKVTEKSRGPFGRTPDKSFAWPRMVGALFIGIEIAPPDTPHSPTAISAMANSARSQVGSSIVPAYRSSMMPKPYISIPHGQLAEQFTTE